MKSKCSELQEQTIIPLVDGPDDTPLYLVHPAGGLIFPYFRLVKLLENCFPIYGIQVCN